jgi:hypothetical protein
MDYWIFNVRNNKTSRTMNKGIEIYHFGMEKSFWKIKNYVSDGKRTPNVSFLKNDDRVIFYLAGKEGRCFLGTCLLDSSFKTLSLDEFKRVINDENSDWCNGVFLKNIVQWDKPIPVRILLGKVSFINEIKNYGSFIQGSIRKISKKDFEAIVREQKKLKKLSYALDK